MTLYLMRDGNTIKPEKSINPIDLESFKTS